MKRTLIYIITTCMHLFELLGRLVIVGTCHSKQRGLLLLTTGGRNTSTLDMVS